MIVGSGVSGLADEAGRHGAGDRVHVVDDPALEAPLPQPRVDALAAARATTRASTTCSSRSPCSPPTSPPGSPRGSTPASTGTSSTSPRTAGLTGKRPALADSVSRTSAGRRRRGWRSSAPARSTRSRRAAPRRSRTWRRRSRTSRPQATMVEQAHAESTGPSIEDADVIVAGGRGLGAPEGFALAEELAEGAGRRRRRDARRRRRGLVSVRGAGRPDRQDGLARSSTSRSASPARSSTRSACRPRT